MSNFEIIEGDKKGKSPGAKPEITEKKLEVISGGRSFRGPAINRETEEQSVIREEKIFSREEVLEIIYGVAKEEGFEAKDLAVKKEIRDAKDNLIILEVATNPGKTKGAAVSDIRYIYIIQGSHGGRGFSNDTCVMRTYTVEKNDKIPSAGGVVANYRDGKWILHPNYIAPAIIIKNNSPE